MSALSFQQQQPGYDNLLPDIDPDLFDVGNNFENPNDWVSDELSCKNPTKKAKAFALEVNLLL